MKRYPVGVADFVLALGVLKPQDDALCLQMARLLGFSVKRYIQKHHQEEDFKKEERHSKKEDNRRSISSDETRRREENTTDPQNTSSDKSDEEESLISLDVQELPLDTDTKTPPLEFQPPSWLDKSTAIKAPPLYPRHQLRGYLSDCLMRPTISSSLDIPKLVDLLARRSPVDTVCHSRMEMPGHVQLVLDKGDSMEPFSGEQRLVERTMKNLYGEKLDLFYCELLPYFRLRSKPKDARLPASGSAILIVSDFGIGQPILGDSLLDIEPWIEFAQNAERAGASVHALVPYGRTRWPKEINVYFHAMPWFIPKKSARENQQTQLASTIPDAPDEFYYWRYHRKGWRLAVVASLANYFDGGWLRLVREYFFPNEPPDMEADVWLSPDINGKTTGSFFALIEEHLDIMRTRLKNSGLIRAVWDLLLAYRKGHQATEVLQVEEYLRYLKLTDESLFQKEAGQLLRWLFRHGLSGPDGWGLARWSQRAIPLIQEVLNDENLQKNIELGARFKLGYKDLGHNIPTDGFSPWLLPDDYPNISIYIYIDGEQLVISEKYKSKAFSIQTPDTHPRFLYIETSEESLTFMPGESKTLPLSEGSIILKTLNNKCYLLTLSVKTFDSLVQRWVGKLIVLGEGGVGKTSLLRQLRGEGFRSAEDTTHGIEQGEVQLPHPILDHTMTLLSWDFGGQQIYHATHQFFVSEGALILLVWNARLGYEQGKLEYWLENIKSRAYKSTILLVATHTDQRRADIPLYNLRSKYPNLKGQVAISNKTGFGITNLIEEISTHAARLPLMGERWPKNWIDAIPQIRYRGKPSSIFKRLVGKPAKPIPYLTTHELFEILRDCEVDDPKTLALRLHELGEIIWYSDVPELCSWVITDAQFLTQAISDVLSSQEVANKSGVLSRKHLRECWSGIDPAVHEHLRALMEHFDLSYKIPAHQDASLVVELLPFEPPAYEEKWQALAKEREIGIHMQMKAPLPPGIPTWFIARMHRFSLNMHWRYGAMLGDERHVGLIEVNRERRNLILRVRGPNPWPFFAQLCDGLDNTLARYPGLEVDRLIPCPNETGCHGFFVLDSAEKAVNEGIEKLQCRICLRYAHVENLLYGRTSASIRSQIFQGETPDLQKLIYGQNELVAKMGHINEQIKSDSDKNQSVLSTQLQEMAALLQRQFHRLFLATQINADDRVPTVFTLRPTEGKWHPTRLTGQEVKLQLFCEYPGHWHPTQDGGCYTFKIQSNWLKTMSPYIKHLSSVMKIVIPAIAPILKIIDQDTFKCFERDLRFSEDLVSVFDSDNFSGPSRATHEVSLRTLRALLIELDPSQTWGNLLCKFTPEGEVLWLCPYHYDSYDPIKTQGRPPYPG